MKISLEKRWEGIQWIPFRFPAYLIRNEKVGCSIHLSGTNIDKGSLLSK